MARGGFSYSSISDRIIHWECKYGQKNSKDRKNCLNCNVEYDPQKHPTLDRGSRSDKQPKASIRRKAWRKKFQTFEGY